MKSTQTMTYSSLLAARSTPTASAASATSTARAGRAGHASRAMALGVGALAVAAAWLALSGTARAADAPVSSPAVPQRPAAAAAGHGHAHGHGHKAPAKPRGQRLQAICSAADLNHDGSVSLDEFHQDIVQSWHSLSPDATGYVQLADLAQVPGMGKGRVKRLAASDKDGDGKLSFKEVVETRMAYFEAADTNQNDELSIDECVAYERQRRGSKQ
ncbi:EF-hand domain-containing protein [Acidovorax sp. LjRoot194]|uniref:EF-hand domain-containing protein n=1 Tax=Acidovorax sp. LjRoot194 TaxID=3342280 RepID=UPI003ECE1FB9